MELRSLTTFLTIVETGSFALAAERLNYTPSAITFQIGQLEEELGVPLFEKIGRTMTLTKAGEELLPRVREVMGSVERLRCLGENPADCRGELRIGVGETLLCYRIPEVLQKFHALAPNTRLYLRSMNCYDIRDELLEGKLDLGVFYEDVGGFGSRLECRDFGIWPVVLAAAPETARQYPDFITPDQHIPVPFLINEPNCIFRQIFEDYLRERSIRLDHTIELWSIPTIKNLVRSGLGVTFLPRFAVEEELRDGTLTEIPTCNPHTAISAVCACHRQRWQSPSMRLFLELCRELGAGGQIQLENPVPDW